MAAVPAPLLIALGVITVFSFPPRDQEEVSILAFNLSFGLLWLALGYVLWSRREVPTGHSPPER